MKMRNIALLTAAVLATAMPVSAQETEQAAETEMMTEAAASDSDTEQQLSDKWSDFQIQIDGTVYQFPMMYDDFVALGWSSDEVEGQELEPNQYGYYTFYRDDVECSVYLLNFGVNTEPAEKCIVGGLSIDNYFWPVDTGDVVLPGGIEKGKSDVEAIKAAYGTPSDTYEGELYTELTYETDIYSNLELTVYNESGVLEEISLQNFTEPEGYETGEISDEIPDAVASYSKPDSLSDDLSAYQIELDGQVYELPVPVCVLISDGWELDESNSDSAIKAQYYGWVTLRKGGQQIREIVVNQEDYGTVPENCWLEGLEIGGYTLEADGSLPGGIREGMPEEEFLKILEDNNMTYELDESDSFRYYTYNEKGYDQCMEVTVYTDSDGTFEKDTVMTISCTNAFE